MEVDPEKGREIRVDVKFLYSRVQGRSFLSKSRQLNRALNQCSTPANLSTVGRRPCGGLQRPTERCGKHFPS